MRKWYWIFGVVAITALDLWTAELASDMLPFGTPRPLLGHLVRLQLIENRGAMLGIGSGHPLTITILGILGTIVLAIASWRWHRDGAPLALMVGGALGNVMSRLLFGHVVDFIRVIGYPGIFNLADVALRVGVVWLIIRLWLRGRHEGKTYPEGQEKDRCPS